MENNAPSKSGIKHLAFLAPDVIEAILDGKQHANLTVKALTVDGSVPVLWQGQRQSLVSDVGP